MPRNVRGAIQKIVAKAVSEAEALKEMEPGSAKYQATEAKIEKLKAEAEAGREKAQKEFAQKEAEMLKDIYKDIREAAGIIAPAEAHFRAEGRG